MHIILGFLGAIITILILLKRLDDAGIDLGWLNPFAWHRRRSFRMKHDLNPAFKLDAPMDVAALLITGAAKIDGDLTTTQKSEILNIFENEFHLSPNEATDLLTSSVFLISNGQEFYPNPERVIKPVHDKLSLEQSKSIKNLLNKVITIDGKATNEQIQFIEKAIKSLPSEKTSKW